MFKRLLKWILRIVAGLILLVVLLLVFKNAILRSLTEARIREQTGMDATIGSLSASFLRPSVRIQNFKLYNPPGFGKTLFLDVPELYVELDPDALARKELHITQLRFHLGELDIVRNQAGQTNVFTLLARTSGFGGESAAARLQKAGLKFTGIDVLDLSLGQARFLDLQDPSRNREFQLGLTNVVLKNVKTEQDLYLKLFVVLLTNGGGSDLTPQNLWKNFFQDKTSARPGAGQVAPAAPAQR